MVKSFGILLDSVPEMGYPGHNLLTAVGCLDSPVNEALKGAKISQITDTVHNEKPGDKDGPCYLVRVVVYE